MHLHTRFFSKSLLMIVMVAMIAGIFVVPAQAQTGGGCAQYHTVARGENLYRIALRYSTSMSNLVLWNNITNVNRIYAGQSLCVRAGNVVVTPPPVITPAPADPTMGVVTGASYLNVRSGPGVQYAVVAVVARGQTYRAVGRTADSSWYQILISLDGTQPPSNWAWVRSSYLQVTAPNTLPVVVQVEPIPGYSAVVPVVSTQTIYSGPGTNYSTDGAWVEAGMTVRVVGRNTEATWMQILTSTGTGWVSIHAFPAAGNPYDFPITG